MASEVYLDTHVVPWLFEGDHQKLTPRVREIIESHDLLVSPMVCLELQYLYEVKKIRLHPKEVLDTLLKELGLRVCTKSFLEVIETGLKLDWTRDPFDRIITAHAALDSDILITKDAGILKHYSKAVW